MAKVNVEAALEYHLGGKIGTNVPEKELSGISEGGRARLPGRLAQR